MYLHFWITTKIYKLHRTHTKYKEHEIISDYKLPFSVQRQKISNEFFEKSEMKTKGFCDWLHEWEDSNVKKSLSTAHRARERLAAPYSVSFYPTGIQGVIIYLLSLYLFFHSVIASSHSLCWNQYREHCINVCVFRGRRQALSRSGACFAVSYFLRPKDFGTIFFFGLDS